MEVKTAEQDEVKSFQAGLSRTGTIDYGGGFEAV